jgi:hypothetical protein
MCRWGQGRRRINTLGNGKSTFPVFFQVVIATPSDVHRRKTISPCHLMPKLAKDSRPTEFLVHEHRKNNPGGRITRVVQLYCRSSKAPCLF